LLATDETRSVPAELTVLDKYEGLPWMVMVAADSAGDAAYADIGAIPHISDAELASCDTALGATAFKQDGLPILDGSRSACALGTDADSAAPGIFGPAEEPVLSRSDFVENSNDSYWMTNPAQPLTGFPAVIAGNVQPGTDLGLRTRSALTMITSRIAGTDGLGPAGFSFQDMKNLMFSDIQYGATLVKSQLVTMCRSFPGGRAPTSAGGTIAVGDSCDVLAAWDGRENPDSRGAALFQAFWCPFVFTSDSPGALCQSGSPWTHPFSAADPVGTPSGLDTASTAVQQAFGDALASLTAAHLPYDVPLGQVQYVVRNGQRIPLPGGPGDPSGEFNAIDQLQAGADPIDGSSYIQAVTWTPGDPCPEAATLLTYSESGNPTSPHYADQTMLFSQRQWVTPYFCAAQVTAHAMSTMQVRGPAPSRQ
jgi:acyl-homoserine-lactone acylase